MFTELSHRAGIGTSRMRTATLRGRLRGGTAYIAAELCFAATSCAPSLTSKITLRSTRRARAPTVQEDHSSPH